MGIEDTLPMERFDRATQNLTEAFALETELENSTQTHPTALNHAVTPVRNDRLHTNADEDSGMRDPPAIDTDDEMGTIGAPTQATVDMELDQPDEGDGDSENSDVEFEPDDLNNMDVDLPLAPLCIDKQEHLGQLLKIGIDLHPTYRWPICIDCLEVIPKSDMHGHRRNHHPTPRHSPIQLRSTLPLPSTPPSAVPVPAQASVLVQHRVPSDESQAVSMSNPIYSGSQRGSLILWHLPSDGTAALAPPRFNRNSVASTSCDSIISFDGDSKYPIPVLLSQRSIIPYAYDPADDLNEAQNEEDDLHDPNHNHDDKTYSTLASSPP